MHVETESNRVKERLDYFEDQVDVHKITFDSVTKIAAPLAEGRQKTSHMKSKPVSEYKTMQQLKTFGGDRAQVNPGYRKALNNLNNTLDSLDGVLDEDDDDVARILSGR